MTGTTTIVRERSADKDATKLYLKEVSRNRLLTHAEEISLSQTIENAKQQMVLHLFEIPLCVTLFRTAMQKILDKAEPFETAFDVDDDNQSTFDNKLDQLIQSIDSLTNATSNQDHKTAVATLISELPFKSAFYDGLIQPVGDIVKQTTQISGEFLRFAMSKNITRECFLNNYQSNSPNAAWSKFVTAHESEVADFQQRLANLSSTAGMTAQDLQRKISAIRTAQKEKEQAIETMLKSNLRLVVSVAKKYINVSPTPLLDLVQEGNIGLLKAIEKYNWRLGFRFSTYATWWIKQCVLKALNEQHRTIKVPSHMTDLVKRVSRAREDYVGLHGYEPSPLEISTMLDVEPHVVARVWTVAQGTISLETPIGSEEDQNLAAVIEDVDGVNAFEQIAEVDARNAVASVLSELSPKEERVIRMRFGIGVDNECTLEDIGTTFGVTRERIRQIEYKALEKLKQPELANRMQQAFE